MLRKIVTVGLALIISMFSWSGSGFAAVDGAPGFVLLNTRYEGRDWITSSGVNILIRANVYRGKRDTVMGPLEFDDSIGGTSVDSPALPEPTVGTVVPKAMPKTGGGGARVI